MLIEYVNFVCGIQLNVYVPLLITCWWSRSIILICVTPRFSSINVSQCVTLPLPGPPETSKRFTSIQKSCTLNRNESHKKKLHEDTVCDVFDKIKRHSPKAIFVFVTQHEYDWHRWRIKFDFSSILVISERHSAFRCFWCAWTTITTSSFPLSFFRIRCGWICFYTMEQTNKIAASK